MKAHLVPTGHRASHLLKDAETVGILRHTRAIVGCPRCRNDARLDVATGTIQCRGCGTVTNLCAHVDSSTDALMRSEPVPPAREWEGESDG